MPDRLTPTQRAVQQRSQAGGVMYDGQPAGDDLFGDEPDKLATIESLNWSMTGVTIDRELTEDEWLGIVQDIRKIKRAYLWMLADLLVYAIERGYGDTHGKYEKVSELTGYTPEALQNYASIARSVEISRRRENLSFSHHTEVAPLPADEQAYWLEQASINHWSAKRLRSEITNPQLPAETVRQDDAPPDDRPAPDDESQEQEATPLPSSLTDKRYRQRFNYAWKKVVQDDVDQETVGDLTLIRDWCIAAIQRANRQLQARKKH
jgi:hypothetical protein